MFSLFISLAHGLPINDKIDAFNSLSYFDVPGLNTKQIDNLLEHEVVKVIDSGDGVVKAKRGVGYLLTPAKPSALWIAYSDAHFSLNQNFHYHNLDSQPPDKQTWYGLVDLPWPFEDRHWVTTSWNNHKMAAATNNEMWEHPWEKSPEYHQQAGNEIAKGKLGAVNFEQFEKAIFLPENSGAIATITIEDQTLLVYHATGTIGGVVPEDLMLRYLLHSITDLLKGIEERAINTVPKHYRSDHHNTGAHSQIIGGDGNPILFYP
jgi:hypothetical protein